MHSLTNYAFGSHLIDWLALAIVVVLTLAVRTGVRRFIFRLLERKHHKGKGEREYWRIHGGGYRIRRLSGSLFEGCRQRRLFLAELRCT